MAKKYLSKIVKDGQTIFMKDAEAQAAIAELEPVEYASVAETNSAISELT